MVPPSFSSNFFSRVSVHTRGCSGSGWRFSFALDQRGFPTLFLPPPQRDWEAGGSLFSCFPLKVSPLNANSAPPHFPPPPIVVSVFNHPSTLSAQSFFHSLYSPNDPLLFFLQSCLPLAFPSLLPFIFFFFFAVFFFRPPSRWAYSSTCLVVLANPVCQPMHFYSVPDGPSLFFPM